MGFNRIDVRAQLMATNACGLLYRQYPLGGDFVGGQPVLDGLVTDAQQSGQLPHPMGFDVVT